ncbi:putative transcriptional regulator YheO [Paraburkholderia sp. GAS199]|uniref:helix-turn-helix transcriptional regulator n=1 Tax=Paraburkholderia sp. GAS199 TaxID=3035126 RepID=UPI003D19FA29
MTTRSTRPRAKAVTTRTARHAAKPKPNPEQQALLDQVGQIAAGLAQTFAPFCEVVVHDLLDPKHAVLAIHNNLSGREAGHPATELGLARIADPDYPQVIANYGNQFADGRPAKSTSIGIKDSSGQYIAALCMNIDLTLFRGLQSAVGQFVQIDADAAMKESLDPAGADLIRQRIDEFAARRATTPRALKTEDRRALLRELKESGIMEIRRAMETAAHYLGVSRATVYSDAR